MVAMKRMEIRERVSDSDRSFLESCCLVEDDDGDGRVMDEMFAGKVGMVGLVVVVGVGGVVKKGKKWLWWWWVGWVGVGGVREEKGYLGSDCGCGEGGSDGGCVVVGGGGGGGVSVTGKKGWWRIRWEDEWEMNSDISRRKKMIFMIYKYKFIC
ncbi:hypothetical protein Hanom_Chr01g00065501 [Helianthus anomalus]